ncbi:MAG: site-specific integrase [Propionibacteriaceae bacterium]|jgi:integrase|nr:site-specific integrase [Propionibacteriaceae bacterium]
MAARRDFGSLRKLPSGRWQAQFTGIDGRRHKAPGTFTDKASAEAWLRKQQRAMDRAMEDGEAWEPPDLPKAEPAPMPTFGEFVGLFLAGRQLRPRTEQDYRRLAARHLLPTFGHLPLDEVTPARVAAWHARLLPGRPTERAHAYSLGRTVMVEAVRLQLIPVSPFTIRGAGRTRRRPVIDLPGPVEVGLAAEMMPERLRLAVLLAASLGLRSGEVRALRRHDVDFGGPSIKVARGVTQVNGAIIVGPPKTAASARTVPMPGWLAERVAEHLDGHVCGRSDAWLFPGPSGEWQEAGQGRSGPRPLSQTALNRAWVRARGLAGLDLRFHDLRHWAATMAIIEGGASEHEAGQMLGQDDPGVIRRYVERTKDRPRAIVEAMPRPGVA